MIDTEIGLLKEQKKIRAREEKSYKLPKAEQQVSNQPKVLMYHRIVEDRRLSNHQDTCLHVDDFKNQLKLLNQLGYTPITFRDYHLYLQGALRLPKKPIILTFDDGYEDFYHLAYPVLKEQGMKAVVFVLGDRSITSSGWDADTPGMSEAPLMNDKQILELHSNGFEIGAHTLSHPDLTATDYGECHTEIYKPKLILEALLDSEVLSFCYPYGMVNGEIKRLVEEAGYQFGCSVFSGPAEFGKDPFEIRRIEIQNTTSLGGFLIRVATPYEYLEWIWWKAHHPNGNGRKNKLSKDSKKKIRSLWD